jgi:parallel beta-helix repeat protein
MQNGNGGTGAGILVSGNESRIERNHLTLADYGLQVTGNKNYVSENTVRGNTANYAISGTENQLNLLLCEIPQALSWPCSVKLAGTLTCSQANTNGITVTADNVTIDLAGHALVGPGATSGHGIFQNTSSRNLRVTNGKAINWRGSMKAGVWAEGPSAVLADLQASTNYYGVYTRSGSALSACAASGNMEVGIYASANSMLSSCTASDNGSTGIYTLSGCSLARCTASGNGSTGIYAREGSVSGCTASYNQGYGIYGESSCVISSCTAYYNDGDGISVYDGCLVSLCTATFNGGYGTGGYGAGICAESRNRIENNTVVFNNIGIKANNTRNFIARNTASGNGINWEVVAGNVCLVVQAAVTTGAISGNSGGTAPGSTDPNANFTQ